MAISEIEKLERRYAENPQGLTFAPLAEIHRKVGDVARALELLRPGLALHPDYIPASIVLGRCHLDLGDFAEAEKAFTHVLSLDAENVIALKAVADISERQLRYDEAERRLNQLLAVDRNHEEAREQLARIEMMRQQVTLRSPETPDGETGDVEPVSVGPVSVEPVSVEPAAVEAEHAPEAEHVPGVEDAAAMEASQAGQGGADEVDAFAEATPEAAAPEEPAPEPELEPSPLVLEDVGAVAGEAVEPAEGVELQEEVILEEPVRPLPGLVTPDADTLRDELTELRVEMAEEVELRPSGASEFQMPDASLELSTAALPEPELPAATVPSEETAPLTTVDAVTEAAPPAEPAPIEEPASPAAPAAEPPASSEPPPIVTETMAEVLLRQGHVADALQIYQELARRNPRDERLRVRVAELELRIAAPARVPSYAARDTGGRSVADFFRELLAARLPAAAGASAPPAPASAPADAATPGTPGAGVRPASDALSLSAVFGEERPPVPPAVPTGGVSFDEFFAGPAGGARPKPPAQAPDAKDDDLDQFHAWLQGLKR